METIATDMLKLSRLLSVYTVVSNDDLLIEILLRLPVISLVLFKTVSKRWLSLIKDVAFIKRRSLIPNIDPPSGLFIKHDGETNLDEYPFVPFDTKISWRLDIFEIMRGSSINIFQSRNGLYLCYIVPGYRFCVYNPTVNVYKILPEPLYYEPGQNNFTSMDFDPNKSPYYKVIHATPLDDDSRFRIHTYSSETGICSIVCDCSDPFEDLENEIYWDDAIHWLSKDYGSSLHYKLDFGNKNVILTKIQLPITMDTRKELFESRGCLLLIGEDKTHSHVMNVYEMRNGHSEWSIKYSIDHSKIFRGHIECIAMGEREEDSFMVLGSSGNRVLLYNFVLKTLRELTQLPSLLSKSRYKSTYNIRSFLFIASFASV